MKPILTLAISLFICAGSTLADQWPQWRGPSFNGVAPGTGFPVTWSADNNIAWKFKLSERGSSTPAIWNNHIFVTGAQGDHNVVYCLDRKGKLLWTTLLGKRREVRHKKGSSCNPSPTTDGQHVYVYFKSGDFAAIDFQGNITWQQNLQESFGKDTLWFDLGTSPVLTKDFVIVACVQSGPSYLAGFHKATGKIAWKQDRNLNAPEEAAQTYSTPIVMNEQGQERIVVLGADHVTSHEATTGKETWRVGGLNPTSNRLFRSISSPVAAAGMVFAPYARGKSLTAIKAGGMGNVTTSHVQWTRTDVSIDVPSPIAHDGKVYLCSDRGMVSCLDLKTGKEIWSHQVAKSRGGFSASPILADNRLYLAREDGTTFVLEFGGDPKVVATNTLDEFTTATPVFADGRIFLRTFNHLYCIGQQP